MANNNVIKLTSITCAGVNNEHIGLRLVVSSFPNMKVLKNEVVNGTWVINKVAQFKSLLSLKLLSTSTVECNNEDLEDLGQVQIKAASVVGCIPFDKEPNCNVCWSRDLEGLTVDADNIFAFNQ